MPRIRTVVLALAMALALFAAPAARAGQMTWSAPMLAAGQPPYGPDGGVIMDLSCADASFCAALGTYGEVYVAKQPTAGVASWIGESPMHLAGVAQTLVGISCPTETLCVAVDENGYVTESTNPAAGKAATWTPYRVDPDTGYPPDYQLTAVSCAVSGQQTLCAAIDQGGRVWTSTDPAGGASTWHAHQLIDSYGLRKVACPSVSFCVVAGAGMVYSSGDPADGTNATWTGQAVDAAEMLSCPTTSVCVTGGGAGIVTTSNADAGSPAGSGATWTTAQSGTFSPQNVSCASASLCVVQELDGHELTSTNPTGGADQWTRSSDPLGDNGATGLTGVACTSVGAVLCVGSAGDRKLLAWSTDPAAGDGKWSAQAGLDGIEFVSDASCPSTTLCVATIGSSGKLLTTTDPAGGAAAWHERTVDTEGGEGFSSISCPSAGLCVATGRDDAYVSTDPADDANATWTVSPTGIDPNLVTRNVSCSSAHLCVITTNQDTWAWSDDPADGATAQWHVVNAPFFNSDMHVSCMLDSFCVFAQYYGYLYAGTNPTAANGWTFVGAGNGQENLISDVSCATTSLCVTAGGYCKPGCNYPIDQRTGGADLQVSTDPTNLAYGASWTDHDFQDKYVFGAVACASPRWCVAANEDDMRLWTSSDPGGTWTPSADPAIPQGAIEAIECPSATLCVATDSTGYIVAGTAAGPGVPADSAPPAVSGSTVEGDTLTADPGTWSNSPNSYAYQWEDCPPAGGPCVAIPRATGATHQLTSDDVGEQLRVQVWAVNDGGMSRPLASARTATVTTPPVPVPTPTTPKPAISGTPYVNQILSETHGGWTGDPTGYAYQWLRCDADGANCAPIGGATSAGYTVVPDDVGSTLRVSEVASNAGGPSETANVSDPTAKVPAPDAGGGTPTPTPTPTASPTPVPSVTPTPSPSATATPGDVHVTPPPVKTLLRPQIYQSCWPITPGPGTRWVPDWPTGQQDLNTVHAAPNVEVAYVRTNTAFGAGFARVTIKITGIANTPGRPDEPFDGPESSTWIQGGDGAFDVFMNATGGYTFWAGASATDPGVTPAGWHGLSYATRYAYTITATNSVGSVTWGTCHFVTPPAYGRGGPDASDLDFPPPQPTPKGYVMPMIVPVPCSMFGSRRNPDGEGCVINDWSYLYDGQINASRAVAAKVHRLLLSHVVKRHVHAGVLRLRVRYGARTQRRIRALLRRLHTHALTGQTVVRIKPAQGPALTTSQWFTLRG